VIKTLEAQVGQFLVGCKCPVSRGIVVQEQDPLGDLPHVQIFMNDGPNPLTWDVQLLSYWFSQNPAVFQDSALRYREVCRAKDLPTPSRMCGAYFVLLWGPHCESRNNELPQHPRCPPTPTPSPPHPHSKHPTVPFQVNSSTGIRRTCSVVLSTAN
jgi:hypothetical protein